MQRYFSDAEIQLIEKYMEEQGTEGNSLDSRAANKTSIPLERVAVLEFSLAEGGFPDSYSDIRSRCCKADHRI